jgi:hypothetical protein
MKSIFLIICITLSYSLTSSISGFESTAYKNPVISIPATGNSWVVNDLKLNNKIIQKSGISGWSEQSTKIRTWFRAEKTGKVNISLIGKVTSGESEIRITLGTTSRIIKIINSSSDTIQPVTFTLDKTGYQFFDLEGIKRTSSSFAEISSFVLSGPVTEGKLWFIKDDFYFGRRGPSVHLRYDIPPEATDIEWFYNEITIPEGNDVIGSYFMANGFADGYFGIQVNSETERRILFSVWSPYKTDNPGEIPQDYRIILLKKGNEVISKEFGNEGSGGQSYRVFPWKAGTTYKFLLKGHPSVNNSTDYTAYFYAPERGKWELIAGFRRPKTDNHLKSLYSFLENFMPETGPLTRRGLYSNQWVCDGAGKWHELASVKFTADATARKESRLDYAGGVENGVFFLKNCGFFSDKTDIDKIFTRSRTNNPPKIDFSSLE